MNIRSFIFGILIGAAAVGGTIALAGTDPTITGDSGTLTGYEVVDRDGKRICKDPDYMKEQKIISCE